MLKHDKILIYYSVYSINILIIQYYDMKDREGMKEENIRKKDRKMKRK